MIGYEVPTPRRQGLITTHSRVAGRGERRSNGRELGVITQDGG